MLRLTTRNKPSKELFFQQQAVVHILSYARGFVWDTTTRNTTMPHTLRRPAVMAGIFGVVAMITAAAQASKLPGGVFKTSDGTNTIALDFDSSGALNVYVNNESFSNGSWQVKADTWTFGKVQGPEGYSCATEAKYLWAIADNRITFKLVGDDDCQSRRDGLLGMVWTKG